jgi:hypothetical protein
MIVAMVAMGMMQVPVDQIVDVVTMRDGRMPAVGAMHVLRVVAAAFMVGRTGVRILGRNGNHVLIHMATLLVMKMPIVQEIDVTLMLDRGVPAADAVLMGVTFVSLGSRHVNSPASEGRLIGKPSTSRNISPSNVAAKD